MIHFLNSLLQVDEEIKGYDSYPIENGCRQRETLVLNIVILCKWNNKTININKLDQDWADNAVAFECRDVVMKQWSTVFYSYKTFIFILKKLELIVFILSPLVKNSKSFF